MFRLGEIVKFFHLGRSHATRTNKVGCAINAWFEIGMTPAARTHPWIQNTITSFGSLRKNVCFLCMETRKYFTTCYTVTKITRSNKIVILAVSRKTPWHYVIYNISKSTTVNAHTVVLLNYAQSAIQGHISCVRIFAMHSHVPRPNNKPPSCFAGSC